MSVLSSTRRDSAGPGGIPPDGELTVVAARHRWRRAATVVVPVLLAQFGHGRATNPGRDGLTACAATEETPRNAAAVAGASGAPAAALDALIASGDNADTLARWNLTGEAVTAAEVNPPDLPRPNR